MQKIWLVDNPKGNCLFAALLLLYETLADILTNQQNKMKQLIFTLFFITSLTSMQAQTGWTLVEETYIKGSISGTITQGYIFKVSRDFYVINERTRQRVRTRNPDVKIYQNGSDYKLVIDDFDE